jgi:hypothetical protein
MLENERKIRSLYASVRNSKPDPNGPFFGFKIACTDSIFYRPQISLYIPYLGETIQQTFVFTKGWQQFRTTKFHSISSDLDATLIGPKKNDGQMLLEAFLEPGKEPQNFYSTIVDKLELYKIREYLTVDKPSDDYHDFSLSSMFTVKCFEMTHFTPDKKLSVIHKEENLYSGMAYLLDGFNEPIHLGSFYNMEKKDLDKNLHNLFL